MSQLRNDRLSASTVRFGLFEADFRSGELRKQGIKIKLHQQPLQILQILLEHPGEVLSKEDLQKRIWQGDTFVDFDHGLYSAIKKLREALGDDADEPHYIETLPKRGYRFIGQLKAEQVVMPAEAVNGTPAAAAIGPPKTNGGFSDVARTYKVVGVAVLCAFALGLLFVALNVGGLRGRIVELWHPPAIRSLAVLPLENLSDDPAQKYFSYGMTEELTTDLAKISGLKVISHTSTSRYENNGRLPSLPQIGRELDVDGIVEGAVQRSGDRVRITVQLIYAPEDRHLWAESYDREFNDVLALQSNVAATIVAKIRTQTAEAKPSSQRSNPTTPNLQALESYLQGNYSLRRMGSGEGLDSYRSAITFFKQAIADDPTFAPAYVGLAKTYDAQFEWRPNEIMPLEKAAVAKALELDPASADAHLVNAAIKSNYDCDLLGSEKEIKEALRLNPNLAEAHEALASYLVGVQRPQEAMEEAHRAQELDPEGTHETGIFMSTGQYDRAIEQLSKDLVLNPNNGFDYINGGLVDAYAFKGMRRESVGALAQAWRLFGFKAIGEEVDRVYKTSGYEAAYRYSAQRMEGLYAQGKVYEPDYIASWYARSGDKEQSLKWLKIAYMDNGRCMGDYLDVPRNPDFAFLKSDPRFQELLRRAQLRQ